jgi:hypothetical protein
VFTLHHVEHVLQEVLWLPLRLLLSLSARPGIYVTAFQLSTSDDGTALVRFAAGNFRIVAVELLNPATEVEAEEYYSARAA